MCSGTYSYGSATRPSGKIGKSRTVRSGIPRGSLRPRSVRISPSMTTTALLWYRRDLRVVDHPGLTFAVREYDRVVPVFVFDDALLHGRFASTPRTAFMLGCLRDL